MTPTLSTLLAGAALAIQLPIAAQVTPTVPEDPTAPAAADAVAVDQIEAATLLLSGYHGIPEAAVFEQNLTDPVGTLLSMARDPDISPIHRDRAIGALAYWPQTEVEALYVELLAADDTPEMVRHRVIGHMAVAFGDSALPYVEGYLQSQDVQFRLTAVHAIGQIGTPDAMQLLDNAARVEPSEIVLERIQEATQLR